MLWNIALIFLLILGSRAGAIIAACWATMMFMGEEGYIESTKKIIETTRFIEKESVSLPFMKQGWCTAIVISFAAMIIVKTVFICKFLHIYYF